MCVSMIIRKLLLPVLLLVFVHCALPLSVPGTHPLFSAVHHFETLRKIDNIQQRIARDSSYDPQNNPKIVQFTTLGRTFKLLLHPHTKPFHPHFNVHFGKNAKVPIDVYQFHHGRVIGVESSHVIAHLTNDGVLTAVIMTDDDWYYIEPSSRHFAGSHDFHMIAYRGSDLKFNMTGTPHQKFCGSHDHHDDVEDIMTYGRFSKSKSRDHTSDSEPVIGRLKRQSDDVTSVCPINLVATTSFFQHFGASNEDHTVNFLLVVLLMVDDIFSSTDWVIPGVSGSASPGVRGLQIADVIVFNSTENSPAYNQDRDWSSDGLLREFALSDWSDYCVSHLFTARAFSDSARLGVAYTAFADSLRAGGICSRRTSYQGEPFSGNVGASTFRGSDRFLVLAEAVVVTGHEFGHSWGSGHDPDTSECSPPFGADRGKFLMYAFAQDGQSRNNMVFSDCSRQAISLVLSTHEDECFEAPSTDRCGDYRINAGEECDPGPSRVLQGGDDCCNANCTFKTANNGQKYNCSDVNHDCCFNCSPSPVGEVCREEEEGNSNCFANKTCDGGINCPTDEVFVEDGASCGIMGECMSMDGSSSCTNFCELKNLTTCFCTGDDECQLCCMDQAVNGSCVRFQDPVTPLPDGRFCEGGTCNGEGECIPSDPDLSTFLFDLLTNFNTAAFVQFLEENIVGAVIILSLIVWIPASVGVHLFDVYLERRRERLKKEKEEEKKNKKKNRGKGSDDNITTPLLSSNDEVDSPKHSAHMQLEFNEGKSLEFDPITTHVALSKNIAYTSTEF